MYQVTNRKLEKIVRLDKNCSRAVSMGLSKAFYTILHDLLMMKMEAYGFSIDAVILKLFFRVPSK